MKEIIHKKLVSFLTFLLNKLSRKPEGNTDKLPFSSLSPSDNADIDGNYSSSLLWALENTIDQNIKNIALTGPYGSGKSSVLRTFEKKYQGNRFEFLNISLATFKEINQNNEENFEQKIDYSTLNLIEASILQQIFYKEKDEVIPDSRFKKIKNFTKKETLQSTLLICIWVACVFRIFFNDNFKKLFGFVLNIESLSFITKSSIFNRYIPLLIVLSGATSIIYKSIRAMSRIKLSKINIFDAEIEVSSTATKSILNQHIDEIVYFFEVTNYNVVVIEDLDRFNQTDIFTKLREINTILNSSKKINRPIVFIYAVRDDMFKDKDRAKFFDFIIPIIPVINYSNSSEKLLEKKVKNSYQWNDDLIEDIAFFVDDMRLLFNITNEFHLYLKNQNSSLDHNKLLALLVYKNIYPNDFVLLSEGKGILFNAIGNKKIYIDSCINKLNARALIIKNKIAELEKVYITEEAELRSIYLLKLIELHPGFTSFYYDYRSRTVAEINSQDYFQYLIEGKISYYSSSHGNRNFQYNFQQLENSINSNKTYEERLLEIKEIKNSKIQDLKSEIQLIESTKRNTYNYSIKNILSETNIEIEGDDIKQKKLLTLMLRSGYIDESYLDYISIFYEGSLTKNDYDFLLNTKMKSQYLPFGYQLYKINNLVKKININDFEDSYIFNAHLLKYIMSSSDYEQHVSLLIAKLSDESKESIAFIDYAIHSDNKVPIFIQKLTNKWPGFWDFINTKSNYLPDKVLEYFKLILEYADIQSIEHLNNLSSFKVYILERVDFLEIIPDSNKIQLVIKRLNIKLRIVSSTYFSDEMFLFFYEGYHYHINDHMIKLILAHFNVLNEIEYNTRNYSSIMNSLCAPLILYIDHNIELYLKTIYLPKENNQHESEDFLLKLLTHEKVSESLKIEVIKKSTTKISTIEAIDDIEILKHILINNILLSNWENIYDVYILLDNELTQELINFINSSNNANELSSSYFPTANEHEFINDLVIDILQSNSIADHSYSAIFQTIEFEFHEPDLSEISKAKLKILCDNSIISFSHLNFQQIREKDFQLSMLFIEKNKDKYLGDLASFAFELDDIRFLLKSSVFSNIDKVSILNFYQPDILTSFGTILSIAAEIILKNNHDNLSNEIIFKTLYSKLLNPIVKIKVFNLCLSKLENLDFTVFFDALGGEYAKIAQKRKKPSIDYIQENLEFAENLKKLYKISSYSIKNNSIKINTFIH